MKKTFLLIAVLLLSAPRAAHAEQRKLGVTFDLTYVSKYLSKGA